MKNKRVEILVAAVVLFVSASPVMALIQLKDGGVHDINYQIGDSVFVDYLSPGRGTTVNILEGGSITGLMFSFEDSIINIQGGSIGLWFEAYGSSQVTVSSGSIGMEISAHDSSQVTVSGGSVDGLFTYGSNQATVSGGSMYNLIASGSSQVTVSGGSISHWFEASGSSQVDVSGGLIGGELRRELAVGDTAVLTITGSDFAVDGTPVGYTEFTSRLGLHYTQEHPYRRLTGILASGELLNNDFRIGNSAKIVLVPGHANNAPFADAGEDQRVSVGDTVDLNGSASSDPDDDPLTYSWSFVSKPAESLAEIVDPTLVEASFVPHIAGEYVVSLVVNDGSVDSDPATVTVTVITPQEATLHTLEDMEEIIGELPLESLKNKNLSNALTNKINAALAMINEGDYEQVLEKLQNDILKKTDGCAETGEPHKNDWILTCQEQEKVYPLVLRAIELLERLIE